MGSSPAFKLTRMRSSHFPAQKDHAWNWKGAVLILHRPRDKVGPVARVGGGVVSLADTGCSRKAERLRQWQRNGNVAGICSSHFAQVVLKEWRQTIHSCKREGLSKVTKPVSSEAKALPREWLGHMAVQAFIYKRNQCCLRDSFNAISPVYSAYTTLGQ